MSVGKIWHYLAYAAAAVSLICVILAGVSRLLTQTLGLEIESYMTLAIVAVLFAIFLLIEGAVYSD